MCSWRTSIQIQSAENRGVSPAMHQLQRPNRIFLTRSWCCASGGISSEWSTMSYSSLTKPSPRNVTNKNWCNEAEHCSSNAPNMPKDMTNWSCSTTTLGHTLLKSSRKLWKHLTEISTPLAVFARHCSFGLPLVPFDGSWPGWAAFNFLWKSQKLGRFVVRLKRRRIFETLYPYAAWKVVKDSRKRWAILWITYIP